MWANYLENNWHGVLTYRIISRKFYDIRLNFIFFILNFAFAVINAGLSNENIFQGNYISTTR